MRKASPGVVTARLVAAAAPVVAVVAVVGVAGIVSGCDGAKGGAQGPSGSAASGDGGGAGAGGAGAGASAGGGGGGGGAWAAGDGGASSFPSWVDFVRTEAWDAAARALDALPEAQQKVPEIRYVRARVALERGDAKPIVALLDGLEAALPLLADDIARRRAEAKLAIGPFAEAAAWFDGRPVPSAWLKASEAWEKAGQTAQARAACDRVVAYAKRSRGQEAEARACRVRLGGRPPQDDAADARWLAVEAPDLVWGKDKEALLARLDPAHPLTGDEALKRVHVLADAGQIDDALRALDRVPASVPSLERLREKGDVLFHARSRGLEAAKVLDQCSAAGGSHAVEDAFHAARALSRADHDDEAIARYERLVRSQPKSPWADDAAFLAARLHLLHARWAKAAAAFDAYAKQFPKGADRVEAERLRAVAHYENHEPKIARKLFEQLADDDGDSVASARASELAAVAAWDDGDHTHAIARWTDIARTRPLGFAALASRARLAKVGAPLPPVVEPPEGADATAAPPPPLAITLPPPVDVLHRVGLDADAESELREREGLVSAGSPGRAVEALCASYGAIGRAKRRYQVAQQIPGALLSVAPSAKNRWAWECAFPTPYDRDVSAQEKALGLPRGLVWGVMRQESGFDPDVVSPARAVGLLQLLPETARVVALAIGRPYTDSRLTSPDDNIALGARYLRELVDKFHGQVPFALGGYNGGPDVVERWIERMRGVPLDVFVEQIPFAETRAYVARVVGNWARYAYLLGGEAAVPAIDLKATGERER